MNEKQENGQNKDSGRWRNPHSISAAQFDTIRAAAEADGVTLETEPAEGPPLFIWQKDHILVRTEVNIDSNEQLRRLGAVPAEGPDGTLLPVRDDLVKLVRLANNKDNVSTREIVEQLNATDDLADKVFVNNLMYVTHGDGANLCPASEPIPVRPYPQAVPYPPVSPVDSGEGVRITVIDTGISREGQPDDLWPWDKHHSNEVSANPRTMEVDGDPEVDTFDTLGDIAPHAGHGMFIAGLIRCVAPRATVRVLNTMRWAGSMYEAKVAQTIMDVLDSPDPPDIISFSAGYMIHDKMRGAGPAAMLDVMRRLTDGKCKTVLVAATGNDGHGPADHGLFYPAAFAATDPQYVEDGLLVAVGALRQDLKGRACFSNYGDWVTVYEEGENLVNAFPHGRYTYREPLSALIPPKCTYYPSPPHDKPLQEGCSCLTAPAKGSVALFHGMASWSGTSFATPIVAARIARYMTENGLDGRPREAVQQLLKDRVEMVDAGDKKTKLQVFRQPAVT